MLQLKKYHLISFIGNGDFLNLEGKMEQNNKISRTIRLNTRRTSIKMENVFWEALKKISINEKISVAKICSIVDKNRKNLALTSALRIFTVHYFIFKSNESSTKEYLEAALKNLTNAAF